MKCDEIQESLTAYLDLELSLEERQWVKDHLSICPLCADEINELKKVGQWVHLTQPEADLYFENQLLRVIRSSKKGLEERKSWDWALWNYFRLTAIRRVALASFFLVAVIISYYLGVQSHPYWVAKSVGISQNDLEKINQEIDFYKDYEMIHQLDLLKKMDQQKEERGKESL